MINELLTWPFVVIMRLIEMLMVTVSYRLNTKARAVDKASIRENTAKIKSILNISKNLLNDYRLTI